METENRQLCEVKIVTLHNPFDRNNKTAKVANLTSTRLSDILISHVPMGIEFDVSINGKLIRVDHYEVTHVQNGDYVVAVPILHGGGGDDGGKQVLSVVASIVLMVVSYGAGAAVSVAGGGASAMAGWTSAAYLAAMAVQMAGSFLINSLIADKNKLKNEDSSAYKWNPKTTQQQGLVIPRIYGHVKHHGNVINAYIEEKDN